MSHKPRKIGNLLRTASSLKALRVELDRQITLTQRVRSVLGADASYHLISARLKGAELVIYIDSPGWATRVRLQGPSLLRSLEGWQIKAHAVRIRVVMPIEMPSGVTARATLPESARMALAEAATGTPDRALKASLLRLSRLRRTPPPVD